MFNCFRPTYHAKSIYEVPRDFYQKLGIKNLLIDLDNTLGSYRDVHPSRQASELVATLIDAGYQVLIISNNKGPRVARYADELGVQHLSSAHKPLKRRFISFLKEQRCNIQETLLIGDQLLTDSLVAHRLGIKVLLTEKLVKEDQWTTRFNRLFDRPLRAYFKRKQLLTSWRSLYE